jgi:hypothetical protein
MTGVPVTPPPFQPSGLGGEPGNLGDILERVLDRGIVIAGDIRVSLLDIELLTIKLRLVVASVETAAQMGIDWWRTDPWLTSRPEPGDRGGLEDRAVHRGRRPRLESP